MRVRCVTNRLGVYFFQIPVYFINLSHLSRYQVRVQVQVDLRGMSQTCVHDIQHKTIAPHHHGKWANMRCDGLSGLYFCACLSPARSCTPTITYGPSWRFLRAASNPETTFADWLKLTCSLFRPISDATARKNLHEGPYGLLATREKQSHRWDGHPIIGEEETSPAMECRPPFPRVARPSLDLSALTSAQHFACFSVDNPALASLFSTCFFSFSPPSFPLLPTRPMMNSSLGLQGLFLAVLASRADGPF